MLTQAGLRKRVGLGQMQGGSLVPGCAANYLLEGGDTLPRHGDEADDRTDVDAESRRPASR